VISQSSTSISQALDWQIEFLQVFNFATSESLVWDLTTEPSDDRL